MVPYPASLDLPHALVECVTMLIVTREGDRRCKLRPHQRALVALIYLLDGTLAECDRVGDSRADFSQKHRRHGVNVQVIADPAGNLLWISPALPGRTHDLTAARTHRIIRICERQGVPVLADRAYIGAGPWVTTPIRRLPHQDLNPTQRTINRALSAARAPVERSVARLKSWRIFRRARCSPNRMTAIAAAVLTLERQR
ncbi:transposase family protein [Streptomyces virginiae]|uniref:transposase family protein n=1 Tax=Streptomyces virginiae TaxID=1961 RepID=UPI003446BFA5